MLPTRTPTITGRFRRTDMRNKFVSVWLYIRDAAALAKVSTRHLFVGAPDYSWYMYRQTPAADLRVGWNIVSIETANPDGYVRNARFERGTWVRLNLTRIAPRQHMATVNSSWTASPCLRSNRTGLYIPGTGPPAPAGNGLTVPPRKADTGSTATFMFDGTAVNLIAQEGSRPKHSLDPGRFGNPDDVDLFNPTSAIFQQMVFTQTGLASGPTP